MKNKIISLILTLIIAICTFKLGTNFYHQYDTNRDGQVDIKDMLIIQKYLIEKKEGEKNEEN